MSSDTENTSTETLEEFKLNSVYTTNLPEIFNQLGISLIVSTYQAGKVILLRNENNAINTHFKSFNRPMGIAVTPNKIALGYYKNIINYYNTPALTSQLNSPKKHDACYIPRTIQETGAIDIHEMSYGNKEELYFINTRFSCLCTLDYEYNFRPVWRPPFISSLGPGDRCHLNGLGMKNGKPKYATALGATDKSGEWKNNKRDGGILIDIEFNQIIKNNLSMPHSPRWHDNKIWFLESGHGALACINPKTNEKVIVAKLPGFTRGLDFAGPLAFIGLSQVRETAVFEDFPLLEELEERICGVYVVDIRNGQLVGFVKFEGDIEEIFAVQVLNHNFPELLEPDDEKLDNCYIIPDECLKEVKQF